MADGAFDVLVICGSLRKGSLNAALARALPGRPPPALPLRSSPPPPTTPPHHPPRTPPTARSRRSLAPTRNSCVGWTGRIDVKPRETVDLGRRRIPAMLGAAAAGLVGWGSMAAAQPAPDDRNYQSPRKTRYKVFI